MRKILATITPVRAKKPILNHRVATLDRGPLPLSHDPPPIIRMQRARPPLPERLLRTQPGKLTPARIHIHTTTRDIRDKRAHRATRRQRTDNLLARGKPTQHLVLG